MSETLIQINSKDSIVCYRFLLFIAKDGANSVLAQDNLERICQKWIPGRHEIEVVDVLENYEKALEYSILLTPAVVVLDPPPRLIILGNLCDNEKVLSALNLIA